MKIVLFSKDEIVLKHWQEKLNNIDTSTYEEIISCSSFKDVSGAINDENHVLLYHLETGDEQERICYQFITKYQHQHRMIIFSNIPESSQGLRVLRAGVCGYSNTFLDSKKLLMAIEVILQGKVWIGAQILQKLIDDCSLNAKEETTKNIQEEVKNTETETSLLGALIGGIKKIFG